jgi:hypothetical protein
MEPETKVKWRGKTASGQLYSEYYDLDFEISTFFILSHPATDFLAVHFEVCATTCLPSNWSLWREPEAGGTSMTPVMR